MATLQIEFKNGKFVSHNGVNVDVATNTYIKGNGWTGEVDENGNIVFNAVHYYDKGVRHQLKFKIVNGYVKKILKVGADKPKVLKSYKMEQWPIDGVIGLTAGYIDKRTTYFRTASFQNFLNQHGITAVRFESANGIFNLMQKHDRLCRVFFSEEIKSDGRLKKISRNVANSDGENEYKTFDEFNMVEVTDASWTIKTVWKHGKMNNRILYTLDDPQRIVGLPKFE